jgi:hypothetical protein
VTDVRALDLLLQTSDISVGVPDQTRGQLYLAVGLLVLSLVGVLVFRYLSAGSGLVGQAADHQQVIRGALDEQTPRVERFDAGAVRDGAVDVRGRLDGLFDRTETDGLGDDRPTLRRAGREATAAAVAAWRDRVDGIPAAVVRALELAAMVVLFGAVAVSTGAVVALLGADPSYPSMSGFIAEVSTLLDTAGGTGSSIVTAFPFAGLLFTLALAYGILLAQWLYQQWALLAAALVVAAVVVYYLQERRDSFDTVDELVSRPRRTGARVLTVLVATWATGAGVATAFGVAGFGGFGADAVAFLLSLAVSVWLTYWLLAPRVRGLRRRLRSVAGDRAAENAALLLSQRVITALSGVAGVLVVVYAVVAVADGRLGRILTAYAAASTDIQAAVALLALLVLGGLAYQIRKAWPDIRGAAGAALSRKTMRAVVLGRGVPLGAVAVGYVLAWTLGRSIVLAVVAGIVLGLIARGVYILVRRARYRQTLRTSSASRPSSVTVRGYVLEDADGGVHYYATVDDTAVVADAAAEALAEIGPMVRELAADGEVATRQSMLAAEYLTEYGIVDRDEGREKTRERIRKAAVRPVRNAGGRMSRSEWDDEFDREEFPQSLVDERLAELRDCLRRGPETVVLKRDPWRQTVDSNERGFIGADVDVSR